MLPTAPASTAQPTVPIPAVIISQPAKVASPARPPMISARWLAAQLPIASPVAVRLQLRSDQAQVLPEPAGADPVDDPEPAGGAVRGLQPWQLVSGGAS